MEQAPTWTDLAGSEMSITSMPPTASSVMKKREVVPTKAYCPLTATATAKPEVSQPPTYCGVEPEMSQMVRPHPEAT
jgi:hypothetical protein